MFNYSQWHSPEVNSTRNALDIYPCYEFENIINSLRPRQNGRHFADDIFKGIFLNENVWIPIKFSLKFVPKGPINNIPALVQIMAWRRPGDMPLSEPMLVSLLTYICVTRPQWVKLQPHHPGANKFRRCSDTAEQLPVLWLLNTWWIFSSLTEYLIMHTLWWVSLCLVSVYCILMI